MKKTTLALLSVLALLISFASCSKHKTYAERLAEEKKAIDKYIKAKNIKVISYSDFLVKDSVTDVTKNEYVELQTGLYLQIINKGSILHTDTFKSRDEITVRFDEFDIKNKWFTSASNTTQPLYVDAFIYTNDGNNVKGVFLGNSNMAKIYNSKAVPLGWVIPLIFLRYNAHINLIVTSKLGHDVAKQQVAPYAYEIKSLSLSKH